MIVTYRSIVRALQRPDLTDEARAWWRAHLSRPDIVAQHDALNDAEERAERQAVETARLVEEARLELASLRSSLAEEKAELESAYRSAMMGLAARRRATLSEALARYRQRCSSAWRALREAKAQCKF